MRHAATKARAALLVVLIGVSAAGLHFGQDADPCREAYLQSGLAQQGVSLDEFGRSYSVTLCSQGDPHAADGVGDAASRALSGGSGSE